MGYQFNGFLTANADLAAAAERRWNFCEVKRLEEQFQGFIVRCPNLGDHHPTEGDQAIERLLVQIEEVKAGLPNLSAQFPQAFLVYVEVECFGGTCTHAGLHLLGGEVVAKFEAGEHEVDLATLLQPLGIELNEDQFFRPLTRDYFERDRLQVWGHPPIRPATPDPTAEMVRKPWWRFWSR